MKKALFTITFLTLGAIAAYTGFAAMTIPSVETLVSNILARQGNWIALQGFLTLELHHPTKETPAACRGELLYHRLDEKILLRCYNERQALLFHFQTDDREFELYLPDQKTVYRGSIFDLEDSDMMESHLKPLALYRALKVTAIPPLSAEIEKWNRSEAILNVYRPHRAGLALSRKLKVTLDGDVKKETFYNRSEKVSSIIRRAQYERKQISNLTRQKIYFPHQIAISSHNQSENALLDKTILKFETVEFLPWIEMSKWENSFPEGTEIKNIVGSVLPTFQDQETSG